MVSPVLSTLVCILCLTLLPSVWADLCRSYWDSYGVYHKAQLCGLWYCCGDCTSRYCCSGLESNYLTLMQQQDCSRSFRSVKVSLSLAAILGATLACVAVVLCLVFIICCLCPCCLIYKNCRKRRNQTVTTTTTVVNVPGQPHPPYQYYPGYQPVPALHGYGGLPVPTAPPHPYMEATHPAHFPVPSPLGHPMNPLYSPGESYPPPPPYTDDMAHPPYNPSYGPTETEPKS